MSKICFQTVFCNEGISFFQTSAIKHWSNIFHAENTMNDLWLDCYKNWQINHSVVKWLLNLTIGHTILILINKKYIHHSWTDQDDSDIGFWLVKYDVDVVICSLPVIKCCNTTTWVKQRILYSPEKKYEAMMVRKIVIIANGKACQKLAEIADPFPLELVLPPVSHNIFILENVLYS